MSEPSPNADFEALIDLLGTDDVDENEAGPSNQHSTAFAPVTNLRRPDGRFDFDRIKNYFEDTGRQKSQDSARKPKRTRPHHAFSEPLITTGSKRTPEMRHKPSSTINLPTPHFSPSPSPSPKPRANGAPETPPSPNLTTTGVIGPAENLNSISPLALPVPMFDSQGHRLPEDNSTSTKPRPRPQTAPPDVFSASGRRLGDLGGSRTVVVTLSPFPDFHLKVTSPSPMKPKQLPATTEQLPQRPRASTLQGFDLSIPPEVPDSKGVVEDLRRGLEENRQQTEVLNEALRNVRAEADSLRQQCAELRELAGILHPGAEPPSAGPAQSSFNTWTEQDRDQPEVPAADFAATDATDDGDITATEEQPNTAAVDHEEEEGEGDVSATPTRNGRRSPPMDEIELMSGYEARQTLRALITAIQLAPSTSASEQPMMEQILAAPTPTPAPRPQPKSISDIHRALDFVRTADNLVWKGRGPMDDEHGMFGEKNTQALLDRISLWERAVRNPVTISRRK